MDDDRIFDSSVLNSYASLQNFYLRSNAIEEVLSRREKPFTKVLIPLKANLTGKWAVCQLVTSPFRWILALALKMISKVAECFEAMRFSKGAKIGARQIEAGFAIYSNEPTKLFHFRTTTNKPNEPGKAIYNQPFIPQNRITDLKLLTRLWTVNNGIRFNSPGICYGMSYWFLYLFLKTQAQFSDPRVHMSALSKQFANGGGVDAVLLQSLCLRKGKLLGLKIGTQPLRTHNQLPFPLIRHTPNEWNSAAEAMANKLQNLPAGAYSIGVPRHQTAYIKYDDTLSYFFDPNHGFTEISGINQGAELYHLITKALKETGETNHPAYQRLAPHIDVTPVTLR